MRLAVKRNSTCQANCMRVHGAHMTCDVMPAWMPVMHNVQVYPTMHWQWYIGTYLKPEFGNACSQRGLNGHELLSNHTQHFYADAIELIKASPSTTLSQTCSESSVPLLHFDIVHLTPLALVPESLTQKSMKDATVHNSLLTSNSIRSQ